MTSARHAANRSRFPFAAAIVDDLRAVFGADVAPSYMREGAETWGRALDESRFQVVVAPQTPRKGDGHGR